MPRVRESASMERDRSPGRSALGVCGRWVGTDRGPKHLRTETSALHLVGRVIRIISKRWERGSQRLYDR
jgi:hypothetical protein